MTQPAKSVLKGPITTREPHFLHDVPLDNLVGAITALAAELFVVKDRLLALEKVLERGSSLQVGSIESLELSDAERQARQAELNGFVERIFSELTRGTVPSSRISPEVDKYLAAYSKGDTGS